MTEILPSGPVIEQIKQFVSVSRWGKAASVQTPRQLWRTQGLFTDYQNWTIYRLALGKVNLYHAGWPEYRDCPALQCNCSEETIDHITWECSRARASWKIWIDRWMARETTQDERETLLVNIATRQTPAITVNFMAVAQECTTRWIKEHDLAMATLWKVWTTVTPVLLWRLRNKAVFEGIIYSTEEVQDIIWAAGYYQVTAIASAWQGKSATRVLGYCLETCMGIMKTIKNGIEMEDLDRWLVRYYVKIDQNKLVSGAWMIFKLDGIGRWKLYVAGTVSETSQLGLKDNAQTILQQGIEAIIKITEPNRVVLRVECWDAVSLRKTATRRPNLQAMFNMFFAIQWGKPQLKELQACKQLASADINSIHNFRNNSGTVLPSKPPWSTIAQTQLDVSIAPLDPSTDHMKADSVLNRLFAYQASIGEPHN